MPDKEVRKGDHAPRLADGCGHRSIEPVWDHPDNTDLRKVRKDPCILQPGDTLVVPELEERTESGATDNKHRFVASGMDLTLGITLQNWDGVTLEFEQLQMKVDGSEVEPEDEGEGAHRTPIEPDAKEATLRIDERDATLHIGHLDPVESETGIRARLENLGFRIEDEEPDSLKLAIEEFQLENELWVDGDAGPNTQGKLEEIHGC